MFEFAAMTYGLITSFVMASASRNRRAARTHPSILVLFGYTLMAFSMTTGCGLLGYAGYTIMSDGPVA